MNEQWEPVPDGIVFHYTESIPAEWNYPAHVESIEFLEIRHNGTVIACGSMPKEDEHEANLPPDLRLCRRVAKPPALDAPDGEGWWAFEGVSQMGLADMPLKDVLNLHRHDEYFLADSIRGTYFVKHLIGKWTRLHMPWDGGE